MFESLSETVCEKVQYVCSDMWKPYLNVIAERLGERSMCWIGST